VERAASGGKADSLRSLVAESGTYRRARIQSTDGRPLDFAAMNKVVRRASEARRERETLVMLLDGRA